MRIVFHEMRKIWNIRILGIIVLLCSLYYLLFMSFNIVYFPNGHSMTEEFEYSVELLNRYGPTLEEEEFIEFTTETREKLIAEMNGYIKSMPVFADAGIFSFEDYEKVREKPTNTEAERKAVWTLLGEECDYVRFKLQALDLISERYRNYPMYMLPRLISEAESYGKRETARLNFIEATEEYRNIMDQYTYENSVEYFVALAVLSVLSVLVLVSPLITGDRAREIHLLQYTAKQGRKILRKQLTAIILSAFILTTLFVLIFGAIYSVNGTFVFWNSGITSFLNRTFWIDITYGQYILLSVAMLYIICLGTATFAFLASRFSRNLIALILKLIPVFFALLALCRIVLRYSFSPGNSLYRITRIIGTEPFVCILVMIIGLVMSFYVLRKEKRADTV
jgi:hypothetical protein